MKKILLLSCMFLLAKTIAHGQITSLYYYDPKLINPAFAGLVDEQNYQVHYNGAFLSKYNSEVYELFTAYSNKIKKLNSGVGAIVNYDHVGAQTNFDAKLLYNYQIRLGQNNLLSIGTTLRYLNVHLDETTFHALNPSDTKVFADKSINQFYSSFGIVYSHTKLKIGINSQNSLLLYNSENDAGDFKDYSLFSSYQIDVGPSLKFIPSVYLVTDFKGSHAVQFNLLSEWKFLMLGFSTDADDYQNFSRYSIGFTIIKKIQLITSVYDGVQQHLEGSHLDVMLRVKIANKPQTKTN